MLNMMMAARESRTRIALAPVRNPDTVGRLMSNHAMSGARWQKARFAAIGPSRLSRNTISGSSLRTARQHDRDDRRSSTIRSAWHSVPMRTGAHHQLQ